MGSPCFKKTVFVFLCFFSEATRSQNSTLDVILDIRVIFVLSLRLWFDGFLIAKVFDCFLETLNWAGVYFDGPFCRLRVSKKDPMSGVGALALKGPAPGLCTISSGQSG